MIPVRRQINAFRVYLAVKGTNDSQIIHGTVFVTIGESWDAGWNSCRRGGWSVYRARICFWEGTSDCDLGCAKSVGRRNPSCNSRGWFMLFGEPASIEELTCIHRSWRESEMVPSVYRMVCLCKNQSIDRWRPKHQLRRLVGACSRRMQTGMQFEPVYRSFVACGVWGIPATGNKRTV